MRGVRLVATAALATALVCVALVMAAAILPAPARAFDDWAHDGATGCSCHEQGKPTNASCVSCHAGFEAINGQTCWSCHYPGQDTSSYSSTSADCAQECHLYRTDPIYDIPFQHGENPHLGSLPQCLGCHSPSDSATEPGVSPHHNGGSAGMEPCSGCHNQKQHAGKVTCISCHAQANAFHTYQAKSPGFTKCTGCHAKKHAGRKVPQGKCATCHQGTGGGAQKLAQHSTSITKKRTCNTSGCHSKQLHASKYGSGIKSCSTCHTSKYHTYMPAPSNSVCTSCHGSAVRHANGYRCSLCHRGALHDSTPSAN